MAEKLLLPHTIRCFFPSTQRVQDMTTAIEGMPPSVTLPRFASKSSAGAPQSDGVNAFFADAVAGDGLDFDMLAEYLLDEGTSTGGDALGLSAFDFR